MGKDMREKLGNNSVGYKAAKAQPKLAQAIKALPFPHVGGPRNRTRVSYSIILLLSEKIT